MNNLINQKTVDTSHLTPIEIALGIDENGMTTAKKLYDFLELNPGNYARWCKSNILENPFAEEGKDYYSSCMKSEGKGNFADDFKLTAHFAKKLSMTQKNQKGEAARDYFTKVEDGAKEMTLRMQEMSPQLQVMINMELEQKRQAKEQERQAVELEQVKENQKVIAQALSRPVEKNFREWVNESLSMIAESNNYPYIGSSQERYRAVRAESYERLNRRRPCRLDLKVRNAKGNAANAGANNTQINAINKLTVIEADKDLRPVYESVIKEMLAAYRVNV
ncbi:MAG: antA/AntB antirepressor family protein [[Clostridium] symbiosum]|jgi:phage anti-repressor protein|uniref:antA/AntB antirepressor family protein n=1 Tax=Clostridium symbiosum TaxID=1512 RepID=UPI001897D2D4|nr:antA/AntB antirepressor family protein [[Clostridium] symbiosum]